MLKNHLFRHVKPINSSFQRQFIRKSSNSTSHCEPHPDQGYNLRTRPLLFLGGPFTPARMWMPMQAWFSRKGWESKAWTPALFGTQKQESLELEVDLADNLRKFIQESRAFPPVLICQGYGVNVGLKYLESYPASAAIFISPGLLQNHLAPLLSELKFLASDEMLHLEKHKNMLEVAYLFPEFLTDSKKISSALEEEIDTLIETNSALLPMDSVPLNDTIPNLESSSQSHVPMLVLDVSEGDEMEVSGRKLAELLECDHLTIDAGSTWTWMVEPDFERVCEKIEEYLDESGF